MGAHKPLVEDMVVVLPSAGLRSSVLSISTRSWMEIGRSAQNGRLVSVQCMTVRFELESTSIKQLEQVLEECGTRKTSLLGVCRVP